MKKRRDKKYNNYKKAMRLMKGVVIKFKVIDPLAESDDIHTIDKFYHKNPINRLVLNDMRHHIFAIMETKRLNYLVLVTCVFIDQWGKEYLRVGEIQIDGVLNDAQEDYFKLIEEIFAGSNMAQYKYTEIRLEILGNGGIAESRFQETKKPLLTLTA